MQTVCPHADSSELGVQAARGKDRAMHETIHVMCAATLLLSLGLMTIVAVNSETAPIGNVRNQLVCVECMSYEERIREHLGNAVDNISCAGIIGGSVCSGEKDIPILGGDSWPEWDVEYVPVGRAILFRRISGT